MKGLVGHGGGQGDVDGDGSGDACDSCSAGASLLSAKLRPAGVSADEGAESARYNSTLEFADPLDLALEETGLSLSVHDARDVPVLEVLMPPGAHDGEFGGWRANRSGTRRHYATGPSSDGPQIRAVVRSYRHRPGVLKVTIHAENAMFPTAGMELPLRATVQFTPPSGATGERADAVFGEDLDECRPSADGKRVTCG